ncbi:MAG: hypothetical protein PVF27_10065, partial [Gemmatimonadales bacterium]
EQLIELLESAEGRAALDVLGQAGKTLTQLERIDDSVGAWRELLESASATVEELALAVREYAADIDADPERLAEVERRRDLLYRLAHKYGPTMDDVLRTGEEAQSELELLDTAELDLGRLQELREAAEAELTAATAALTAKRTKAAKKLAQAVQRRLPGLGMPEGKFVVEVAPAPKTTSAGADAVTFVVQLNPGLDARPLVQVASGGELSRLMLALKVVLAGHDAIPTLVFDEVDQGIGGEVALKVGDALAQVGEARQVLVITHLPQIAARAAHHLTVAKRPKGGIATADVSVLRDGDRVREVARMLGDDDDPVVVRHAEELVRRTGGR